MLPNLTARYYEGKERVRRLARFLKVPPRLPVLDVGSGDSPFAAADVVCEKFPWDDRERTAAFRRDRPLVVGDAEALPFRDKAFGYIHCSHVLEHMLHPDRAIEELMRAGRGGYIEVPSAYLEKTGGSVGGHLWFITLEDGTLVFRPKPRGILDPELNAAFVRRLAQDAHYRAYHYARLYADFLIGLPWEGAIRYRVEARSSDDLAAFEKSSIELSHGESKPARPSTLATGLKRLIRGYCARGKNFSLDDVLACPACKQGLNRQAGGYQCPRCQALFPVREGVPFLLKESATGGVEKRR